MATILDIVNKGKDSTTPDTGLNSIISLFPLIFGCIIISIVFKTIASVDGEESSPIATILLLPVYLVQWIIRLFKGKEDTQDTHPKIKEISVTIRTNSEKTIRVVNEASMKNGIDQYINNLDNTLGIRTLNMNDAGYLIPHAPLELGSNNNLQYLMINDKDYDWYITAKQQNDNVFKIIGLHKTDKENNVVYILGRHIRPTNIESSEAFLFKISDNKAESEIDHPTLVEHF